MTKCTDWIRSSCRSVATERAANQIAAAPVAVLNFDEHGNFVPPRRGLTPQQKLYFQGLFSDKASINQKDIDAWLAKGEPRSREIWQSVLAGAATRQQAVDKINMFVKHLAASGGERKKRPDLPPEVVEFFRRHYANSRPSVKDLDNPSKQFKANLAVVKSVKCTDTDKEALEVVRSNLTSWARSKSKGD